MSRKTKGISIALFLAISSLFFVKVFTGDYGTHLAIGRQILESRSIPGVEFLNYPTSGAPHGYTEWLFQALLYGIFLAGGTAGISVFCWVVASATIYFLFRAALVRGAHPFLALLALFAFAGLLRIRLQPRPEICAYLLLSIVMYILSEYYFGTRKMAIWIFPPLIVLWANLHPSFLLAFVAAAAFFVDALAAAILKREWGWAQVRTWVFPPLGSGILAFLASGINPYGFSTFLSPVGLARSQELALSITEMAPVRDTAFFPVFLGAAALGGAAILVGVWTRSFRLLDLLLLAFSVKASYSSARGIALPAVLLVSGVAAQGTALGDRILRGRTKDTGGVTWAMERAGAVLLAVGALTLGVASARISFAGVEYGVGMTTHKYSFAAVRFLRENVPPGNMFNFFDLGGFLDWQLHPVKKTFIDGRGAPAGVYMDYNIVVAGFDGWDRILDRYGADLIVTRAVDSTGMVLPLIDRLLEDRRWALVFSDGLALVFLKDTPGNASIIRRYEISKARIYREIVEEARHELELGAPKVATYVSMGNAYASLGKYREAVRAFRTALESGENDYARRAVAMLEPMVGK